MKDPDILSIVSLVQESVDKINESVKLLHEKDVEIKLVFNEPKSETPPYLYIWKAVEHVDYAKALKK